MILVDASGVSMSRPERSLFDNVSLTISSGDRLAIVGLNGSGKSTLARVLVGASRIGADLRWRVGGDLAGLRRTRVG